MAIADLIQEYQEEIEKSKQAEEMAVQVRRDRFSANCKIWLGQFWGEFKLGEMVVTPEFMSLPFEFETLAGEIRQEIGGMSTLIIKYKYFDAPVKEVELPYKKWGNDRYPAEIPQEIIIQAIVEARGIVG